jgi:hypothetical protein
LQPATLLERIQSDAFWNDPDVQWLTGVNIADKTTYFDKEKFESLMQWLHTIDLFRGRQDIDPPALSALAAKSGYKLAELKRLMAKHRCITPDIDAKQPAPALS